MLWRLTDLLNAHDKYDEYWQQANDPAHCVRPQWVHIVAILCRLVLHPVEEQDELQREGLIYNEKGYAQLVTSSVAGVM